MAEGSNLSMGGTGGMSEDADVRFCERLGVIPGPTRPDKWNFYKAVRQISGEGFAGQW